MSASPLRDKSKEFAKEIVFLYREIKSSHKEAVLTNQLLRSGTSIGANLHEAQYAHSKPDFIAKMQIALKEANETGYWLELLWRSGYIDETLYKQLEASCTSLRVMLISSIRTAKGEG